jgi:hypothetical protein
MANVEVRYAPHGAPEPLSAERKRKILEFAMEGAPADRAVWFMLVLSNHETGYAAIVYFVPDSTTPRLRRGRCAYVTEHREWLKKLPEELKAKLRVPRRELPSYVQVSPAEAPFDDRVTIPNANLMPFDPSGWTEGQVARLDDGELVELVDLARAAFGASKDDPIHAIQMDEGIIRVESGWQVGPLEGAGKFVEFRRKAGGGFQQVGGVGDWVS